MTSQVIFQSIDYRNAKPVAEAVFRIYKELYSYDRTPLGAKLESVDDSSLHWRRERISSPVRASGKCQALSTGMLSKAVHDVGWSSFLTMLAYKAENAGRQLIKVDPRYTSQECPHCHAVEKKPLSERVHRCDCGLTLGRDHAAALVILGRGLRLQAPTDRQLATVA